VLLSSKPSRNHLIFDGVRQSEVVIATGRHVPVLDQLVVQMAVNCLLDATDRRLFGDFGDADSPAILGVQRPGSHCRRLDSKSPQASAMF